MPPSSRPRQASRARRPAATAQHYLDVSRKPLQILVFLLPLVLAYEIGLILLLRSERGVLTNKAHEALLRFFDAFGVAPTSGFYYLGGVAVVVVLLTWHLLSREKWRIDWPALGLMAIESLLLALPLLLIGQLITRALACGWFIMGSSGQSLQGLGLGSKLAISIGAGLYEELLFRMLLIAVVHTLLVDVGKASQRMGATVAVAVSAAAFTAYHPLGDGQGDVALQKLAFFFLAGLYFGAVYVVRGFGIVVGVHALYDVITVSLLGSGDA